MGGWAVLTMDGFARRDNLNLFPMLRFEFDSSTEWRSARPVFGKMNTDPVIPGLQCVVVDVEYLPALPTVFYH